MFPRFFIYEYMYVCCILCIFNAYALYCNNIFVLLDNMDLKDIFMISLGFFCFCLKNFAKYLQKPI